MHCTCPLLGVKRTWIAAKRPVPTLTLAPFPYTSLSRYDALSSALGGGNETTRVWHQSATSHPRRSCGRRQYAGCTVGPVSEGQQTLRFVPQADLKIVDPIWTTAYITRNHGYLVYDTLFGTDENRRLNRKWSIGRGVARRHEVHIHAARRP